MPNIYSLIDQNSMHISDIFNCYNPSINEIWKARKLNEKEKTLELMLTLNTLVLI